MPPKRGIDDRGIEEVSEGAVAWCWEWIFSSESLPAPTCQFPFRPSNIGWHLRKLSESSSDHRPLPGGCGRGREKSGFADRSPDRRAVSDWKSFSNHCLSFFSFRFHSCRSEKVRPPSLLICDKYRPCGTGSPDWQSQWAVCVCVSFCTYALIYRCRWPCQVVTDVGTAQVRLDGR